MQTTSLVISPAKISEIGEMGEQRERSGARSGVGEEDEEALPVVVESDDKGEEGAWVDVPSVVDKVVGNVVDRLNVLVGDVGRGGEIGGGDTLGLM